MYTLKKSLGQHFLRDENVCKKIVASLQEQPLSRLLEVGPGGGALTKYLLDIPGIDFKAVELDTEKVDYLLATYPTIKGKIIHESFLDTALPFDAPFVVIGNFPYNISTEILFKVVEWRDQVTSMTGMFQKEVALRIAASEGNKIYGVTSVLVQAFYDVEYLFEVNEQCFNPPPKVKSAVIRLMPKQHPVNIRSEKKLFLLVKTAFNQRRKTLRNAVKSLFEPDILSKPIFEKRAEALSVADFAALTFEMR
jgi:16S rRNA (adenine1518-N6/adenine1519-N6)-dimethyltransferase